MTEELGVIPPAPGDYQPVVVDWLAGREWPTALGVGVTILDLARQGVLGLSWQDADLVVTRNRAGRHDYEARVLDLLFNRVARDRESVAAGQVRAWLDAHVDDGRAWWRDWEEATTQHSLRALRGAPRGIRLPRRNNKRDRDHLLDQWQTWADGLAATARAAVRHPDRLAEWAKALLYAVPLNRAVDVAARIEGDLALSERAALVGEWCPIPTGATLSDALGEVLRSLPRLDVEPEHGERLPAHPPL